ncbi:hypothetical protein CHS0354_035017 [Potamilus streckersoni]|uniref:CXC MSL2-type domain-containing protein n=1 Tax=Potamilus streckersoni TaxID=2493646 RepID=A0AAE0SDL4_9BIVA|nr:hypothetical protein CHS0354_035017 [Potamilus streckersoni]
MASSTMNAMKFYTSTCRYVMQADPNDRSTWNDLYRCIPILKQSLLCYVCGNILQNPMGPPHMCQHFVCKNCIGGKYRLKPTCSWCKDHSLFTENPILEILLSCCNKLCRYILDSSIGPHIADATINGEKNSLLEILEEIASLKVDHEPSGKGDNCGLFIISSAKSDAAHNGPFPPGGDSLSTLQHAGEGDDTEDYMPKADVHIKQESTKVRNSGRIRKSHITLHSKHLKAKHIKLKSQKRRPSKEISNKSNSCKVFRHVHIKREQNYSGETETGHKGDNSYFCNSVDNSSDESASNPTVKRSKIEGTQMDRRGCRCGKAGGFNQLTCLGQRCPCYSRKLPCIGCRCRGCRNPRKAVESYHSPLAISSSIS